SHKGCRARPIPIMCPECEASLTHGAQLMWRDRSCVGASKSTFVRGIFQASAASAQTIGARATVFALILSAGVPAEAACVPALPVSPTFTCSGTDSSPINYFATPAPAFNFIGETLNSSGAGLVIITPDTNSANTAIVRLDAASSIVTSTSVFNNGILADT